MSRTTITFRLSGASQQQDLLQEFTLHDGVVARRADDDGPMLLVETDGRQHSIWHVRATVGLYDDRAVEVSVRGGGQDS